MNTQSGSEHILELAKEFLDNIELSRRITGTSYTSSSDPRFKFTSKERDFGETGWDYFGSRYYDSRIGRWLQVDPKANKYPSYSPYNYVFNNPLSYTDPHGDTVIVSVTRTQQTNVATKGLVNVSSTGTGKKFSGYSIEPPGNGKYSKLATGRYTA